MQTFLKRVTRVKETKPDVMLFIMMLHDVDILSHNTHTMVFKFQGSQNFEGIVFRDIVCVSKPLPLPASQPQRLFECSGGNH